MKLTGLKIIIISRITIRLTVAVYGSHGWDSGEQQIMSWKKCSVLCLFVFYMQYAFS